MQPEAWTAIGVAVSALSAAASAVLVAVVSKTNTKVEAAKNAAETARDNTVPTSNGFAKSTTDALAAIQKDQEAHGTMLAWVKDALIRHLDEHAGAEDQDSGRVGDHWPDHGA